MSYFSNILDKKSRKKVADRFKEMVDQIGKPELLVGTGVSGLSGCLYLSDKFDIPIAIVRKETDTQRHGRDLVINNFNFCSYKKSINFVFVDDLIDTGKTLKFVLEKLGFEKRESGIKFKMMSVFLYQKNLELDYEKLLTTNMRGPNLASDRDMFPDGLKIYSMAQTWKEKIND
jgi:adenine/guanine phosphoribosyltransferase-like PRPP-binding protein